MITPLQTNPASSPYVGPRPYYLNEPFFFGRERESQELSALLIDQRMLLLYSPAGAGKTSLIQAGLIPVLQGQGYRTLAVIRVGLEHLTGRAAAPLNEEPPNEWYAEEPEPHEIGPQTTRPPWLVVARANPYRMSTIASLEETLPPNLRSPTPHLAGLTLASYLQHYLEVSAESSLPDERGQVLVFDQFDELFWLDPIDQEHKDAFIQELGELLEAHPCLLLFAMREEYVAKMDRYLGILPGLAGARYRLSLLDPLAAMEAIQQPPLHFSPPVNFTETTAQELIHYLRLKRVALPDGSWRETPDQPIEPLQLQAACRRIWHKRQSDIEICASDLRLVSIPSQSDEGYEAGEAQPAKAAQATAEQNASYLELDLGTYYAEWVAAAAIQNNLPERQIRNWFEHALITPQFRRTLVKEERQRGGGLDLRIVRTMLEAGLVTRIVRGGQSWYELAHESLIPVVRQNNAWWHEHKLSLLQRQAELWERAGRPEYMLLRGQALREQEHWAQEHPNLMSVLDLAFLQECLKQRQFEDQVLFQAQSNSRQIVYNPTGQQPAGRPGRTLLIIAAALAAIAILAGIAAYGLGRLAYDDYQQAITANTQAVILMQTAGPAAATANLAGTQVARQLATAQAVEAAASSELQQAESLSSQASQDLQSAESARATAVASLSLAARSEADAESALTAAEKASAQNREALSRQLATGSFGLLIQQPDVSALLAVEAYCSADTGLARSALLFRLQSELQNPIALLPPEFDAGSPVRSLAYSPSGRMVAWGADSPPVVWRNLETNEAFQDPVGVRASRVFALAFSPDDRYLASGGYDGFIVLRDLSANDFRKTRKFTRLVHSLDINRQGQMAAGLGDQVLLWDVEEFWNAAPDVPETPIIEHDGDVYSLAWDPSGERLATGSKDQTVRVTDPARNQVVTMMRVHTKPVRDVAWSRDGKMLASAGDDGLIVIWDPASGVPLGEPMEERNGLPVYSVSFSSDGRLLASGGVNDEVVLWDLSTRKRVNVVEDYFQDNVSGVVFSPVVQAGKNHLIASSASAQVSMFQVVMEQKLSVKLPPAVPGGLIALAVDGDGGLSGVASDENGTQVLHLPTGAGAWEAAWSEPEPVTAVALSLDATTLALAPTPPEPGNVYARVLRTSDWIEITRLDFPLAAESTSPLFGLAFDATAASLAGSQCVLTGPGEETCIPDRNNLQILNTSGGTPLQKVAVGENQPRLLAYDPLGRYLASGGVSWGVQIWELGLGGQAVIGEQPMRDLFINQPITALAFSRDGRLLAVGMEDWSLELWDTQDWERIGYPLLGAQARITSLAFDPFSEWLYVASADGSVQRWLVDPNAWAEQVCELTDRTFSDKEWRIYFGSPPSVPACERLAECK